MLKKIYTILVLIKSLIIRKRHYVLSFVAETNELGKLWYYKFDHWGFDKHNLLMVAGADALCEFYAEGKDEVTVDVVASRHVYPKCFRDYDFYEGLEQKGETFIDRILYGRDYQGVKADADGNIHINRMWICPVTLFVLGRYPNCLYVKRHEVQKV